MSDATKLSFDPRDDGLIMADDGGVVCRVYGADDQPTSLRLTREELAAIDEQKMEWAALIVAAVNEREELIGALRDMADRFEDLIEDNNSQGDRATMADARALLSRIDADTKTGEG